MSYDAIIVGGSFAGLSAALQLGRARRRTLIIDEGLRRNRFVSHSHGFLGQDGRPPQDIVADAREQLRRYETVEWLDGRAEEAEKAGSGFSVKTSDGRRISARRLVLATGVVDSLPDVPGLEERWGRSVFHCPYCHGYELNQGNVGVIAVSEISMHHAMMLPDWGPTTFLLNGAFSPDEEQRAQLARRSVGIEEAQIEKITGRADLHFTDGRTASFAGLFVLPQSRIASGLAEQLGCEFEESPLLHFIKTSQMKETTVSGVFACGDATRPAGSVPIAVADGNIAGAATHQSLIFRED
ncbi:NAD(P)/FAD-dependent oxidoreductase [Rhizobium sp. LCM 4573]|uniref:NAD(P)/FAD-dependent oxidoreductase n=1 Tax=Rhizobium sp. LCM 4573 TaxID=1848291 RepID=UPI0008D90D94|nr:NAD(P)/FAD-dependent oxidoreductase [Rhizobium sp. LCM 4573]OHV76018.1 thioredoxin reductase [Rhizobium sp. LCM 4573]